MLHEEILSEKQKELLLLIRKFQQNFMLVGGTGLALQIGHRESIDFDLFTLQPLQRNALRKEIISFGKTINILVESPEEYTVQVDGVKLTFLEYPFPIEATVAWEDVISVSDMTTIAAMKAYALGRRAKWKDYVDLYFVMKGGIALGDIVTKAEGIFKGEFSEKNFRSQLAYFDDIDYSEAVIFRPGFEVSDAVIRDELVKLSLEE